jgi:hypothetical protein
MEVDRDRIILFGYNAGKYEIGCLDHSNFKPLWCGQVEDADHTSKIIVQKDHVIIFNGNQQHSVFKPTHDGNAIGILHDVQIELNDSIRCLQ